MHIVIHWLAIKAGLLAVVVTAGVAVLLVFSIECTRCPDSKKDDLFERREV